ncbi:MAG: DEAD/DEAH box helicase, partial [Alicyclobacillus sp.]|nr:DEAD/DEAH box helicase [Alicyclobacillus sp.]
MQVNIQWTTFPDFTEAPPVYWRGDDLVQAFSAYVENARDINQRARDWQLFRLTVHAVRARLAPAFEQLLALDHIQGFTPLPHQIETARRVLKELGGRAILADEVGLGKTIEAGLIMKEYLLRGLVQKVLILVPASLVLQWTRELNEKFRIRCFPQRNAASWTAHDVVVASLDTAKREPHRSVLLNIPWDLVVIDEAHKLKNSRTKNWQTINLIPNKYMLLLTATPVQNELAELHNLITLLRPGHLGSRSEFAETHMATARLPKDPVTLRSQLKRVMIRNRRREGGAALPPRHVQAVPLELSPPERALYDAVQRYLRDEFCARTQRKASMLPLITLQREICSSPYAAMMTLEKMLKRTRQPDLQATLAQLLQQAQTIQVYTKVETVLSLLKDIQDKCV